MEHRSTRQSPESPPPHPPSESAGPRSIGGSDAPRLALPRPSRRGHCAALACFASTFLAALAPSTFALAPAASAGELDLVGHTKGGASFEIEAGNGFVYVGAGSTLKVFESGAAPPLVQLDDHRVHSLIHDLKLSGTTLFVAANRDGLWALDVSDPAAIRSLAHAGAGGEAAAYDITVMNDTLYVANHTNVTAYRFEGDGFTRLGAFARTQGKDYVTGCDVRGAICAVTVSSRASGVSGPRNGVHFYDRFTGEETAPLFHQGVGFPEDVQFPEEGADAVFVLGGGNTFMTEGYFYVLDLRSATPELSQEFRVDAVFPGFDLVSVSNAAARNDTLFVTSVGGYSFRDDAAGVWVYDCTDPFDVTQIAWVPQGLLYFDTALDGDLLHVASEWYGVVTIDISDLGDTEILGPTPTGGWNVGTDVNGDWVANALEGYGFEILNVANPSNPELLTRDANSGFCHSIAFSEDRSLLYGGYSTTGGLRIFDIGDVGGAGDPVVLASMPRLTGVTRIAPVGERIYVVRPLAGVTRIDVSDPSSPQVCCTGSVLLADHQDVVAHGDTVMAACGRRMQAFIFSDDAAIQAGSIQPPWYWFSGCDAVAWRDGQVWVPWDKRGVYRYEARFDGETFQFSEAASNDDPGDFGRIAVDERYLYVLRKNEGRMITLDRVTLEPVAEFTAGGGYRDLPFYGATDIRERDGLLFMTDYHSQLQLLRKPGGSHILPWPAP
ncbi:MAG: hypothetical protein CME06_12160 [Gemmatimonadetes bacterium]|nr:hypothetical protein [Gemmatimonadota bacterium]